MDLSWGLVCLRVITGTVFAVHGVQKLFVMGPAGTTRFMGSIGIPLPAAAAIVFAVELLGGLALVVGAGTRVAAALLAVDMLTAMLTVHLRGGFFAPRGVEFPLVMPGAMLALAFLGAGPASVGAAWARRATRTTT